MKLLKRLARKHFKKWNGILLFYMIYDPRKEDKNVICNMIHPDLKQDEKLERLLQLVADRIRLFYDKHPELLEEVDCEKGEEV